MAYGYRKNKRRLKGARASAVTAKKYKASERAVQAFVRKSKL